MKVVILAGGHGTRISEESESRPKPMVEIGGRPILWHIMKIYSSFGFNEFVILLGYKSYMIKEFFANYYLHSSNVTINTANNEMEFHNSKSENWKVTLLETGLETMTGGRIKQAEPFVGHEPFMLTYGDGVANVNLKELLSFHQKHGKLMTLTAIQPDGRFGVLDLDANNKVNRFYEKPKGDGYWINGGFFVCQPEIFKYIDQGDQTIFEKRPLERLSSEGQLMSYKHEGFWMCMDTLRDKKVLEDHWKTQNAPWKVWD